MKVLARPRGQLVQSRCGRRACVVLGKGSPWTPGRETQRRVSLLAAPAPCRQPSKSQNGLKSLRVLQKSTIQLFPSGRFWGLLSKFALRSFFPGAAPLTPPYFHASRDPPRDPGCWGRHGNGARAAEGASRGRCSFSQEPRPTHCDLFCGFSAHSGIIIFCSFTISRKIGSVARQ